MTTRKPPARGGLSRSIVRCATSLQPLPRRPLSTGLRRRQPRAGRAAFTLVEIMIAIGILTMIVAAIYSCWFSILRASKTGQDAAARVQRARIAVRSLEDALTFATQYAANGKYYGFVAENGSSASLSFVAHLPKSFPRGGRYGDLDLRRVTFSLEQSREGERQLVLRQNPVLMDLDEDEQNFPVVLASGVKEFTMEFWNDLRREWTDEWKTTNQLPKLVLLSLTLATPGQSQYSGKAEQVVTRAVGIACSAVPPQWQIPQVGGRPGMPGRPGQPGQPLQPGQPGYVPPGGVGQPGQPPRPGMGGFGAPGNLQPIFPR